AARFQALQKKIYQPAWAQSPPEPEKDRRMYVPSLNHSLTRRDIFTYFCAFGDLERVSVKNGVDSLKYAIVIFFRAASMQLAIAANPHSIKGHRLLCRKASGKSPSQAVRVQGDNPVPQILAVTPQKKTGKSKKSVIPRKGDQTFVYAMDASERSSRWNFNLARSYTTPEEKEALRMGYPGAAKRLLEALTKKSPISSTIPINCIKPTTTLKTQEHQYYSPSIPEHIPNSQRVPASLPPPSPRHHISLYSQAEPVSILKPNSVPVQTSLLLKPNSVPVQTPLQMNSIANAKPDSSVLPNLEFHKPKSSDLKRISDRSYFGPDFRYEHHCYTNIIAYQKTKLYIDLEPGEREKRKTIKEFIDEKYGPDI
ncbi:hypothetical protein KR038_004986, partial [Drosophila bunnanda]